MEDWTWVETLIWLTVIAVIGYSFDPNKPADLFFLLGGFIYLLYCLLDKRLEQQHRDIDQKIYRAKEDILDELKQLQSNKDESRKLIYVSDEEDKENT